jgi:outer membrane protein assembly factor BamA
MRRQLLLFLSILLFSNLVLAQNRRLVLVAPGQESLLRDIRYKSSIRSTTELDRELNNILLSCHENGFLAASYDSIISDSVQATAYLSIGSRYKWAKLQPGNVDEGVLSEIGYRERLYAGVPISFKNVKRLQERLLRYYENNGYPFATVKLDSVRIAENSIGAVLHLKKNSEEKIDSVLIRGSAKIAPIYIYNYLGVKPGDLYNEAQLRKVNTRLRELPFISVARPSQVVFTSTKNKLVLNLDKKRASQFDGILGVLPDNVTGKILFTGDVRLKLQNGIGRGELIDLNWRKLQTETQDLKVHFVYPFLFRTPFGLDYNFKLYKKDTTFLDVNQNIGIQYLLTGGNFIKIFYTNKTSSLLSTKGLEFAQQLPPYADVRSNMYGLGGHYERLDYRLNPRKGFSVDLNVAAGTRLIKKNSKVNPELYEGLRLSTTQYLAEGEIRLFLPLGDRSTVLLSDRGGFIYGENTFQNELFRIGGLKSLRGFDEESIFASAYTVFTLEYRFILEQNSYLYVFGDQAWFENNNVSQYVMDTPTGFGAGVSFETKAGIFSISYALGRQFDNPVQLRSGKVHFGIVNYF